MPDTRPGRDASSGTEGSRRRREGRGEEKDEGTNPLLTHYRGFSPTDPEASWVVDKKTRTKPRQHRGPDFVASIKLKGSWAR